MLSQHRKVLMNVQRLLLPILLLSAVTLEAQVLTFTPEQLIQHTQRNPYERFADGRPKVPDSLLGKMKELSAEDVWLVLQGENYHNQFEGHFQLLHPENKLIGRAVTAQFMPLRPDVAETADAAAKRQGMAAISNQRVLDLLQPGDVVVVDLFGKIEGGAFVGDNLATAIVAATGNGFVIDGAVRDLEGILPIQVTAYFRGAHPTPISGVMLTGINVPIRIGKATVMPGDVVLGDREGVSFVPPHLVEPVLRRAEETRIHDQWTKAKFLTRKYKSSELYPTPADPVLKKEYEEYKKRRSRQ
jgi:4-hydroxy-4-methyl-2-oxoglutarate aldolase